MQRSKQGLGKYAATVTQEAQYLETRIAPSSKKLLVKAHAKYLTAQAEAEQKERKQAIEERAQALA